MACFLKYRTLCIGKASQCPMGLLMFNSACAVIVISVIPVILLRLCDVVSSVCVADKNVKV